MIRFLLLLGLLSVSCTKDPPAIVDAILIDAEIHSGIVVVTRPVKALGVVKPGVVRVNLFINDYSVTSSEVEWLIPQAD